MSWGPYPDCTHVFPELPRVKIHTRPYWHGLAVAKAESFEKQANGGWDGRNRYPIGYRADDEIVIRGFLGQYTFSMLARVPPPIPRRYEHDSDFPGEIDTKTTWASSRFASIGRKEQRHARIAYMLLERESGLCWLHTVFDWDRFTEERYPMELHRDFGRRDNGNWSRRLEELHELETPGVCLICGASR